MKLYSNAPLPERFENEAFACEVFYNFGQSRPNAIKELRKGNFKPFGNLISGGWKWYVENK